MRDQIRNIKGKPKVFLIFKTFSLSCIRNIVSIKMNIQELKVNYKKLLNKAVKANGRKETVSYLNRAAKIKSKIYSNTKVNCFRCNGAGYLRISLDETKTCLSCYGKGFLIKENQQV